MKQKERHILSHAAIYLVARGVPGLLAFIAIPLFTRLLDPADYGRYALVVATVNLLNALLFQWTRLSLVRYLPGCRDDAGRLKSTLAGSVLLMTLALRRGRRGRLRAAGPAGLAGGDRNVLGPARTSGRVRPLLRARPGRPPAVALHGAPGRRGRWRW